MFEKDYGYIDKDLIDGGQSIVDGWHGFVSPDGGSAIIKNI